MAVAFAYFDGESDCLLCKTQNKECEIEFTFRGKNVREKGCIKKMITPRSKMWLSLYGLFNKGFLFYPGALANQPAIYVNAMLTIERTIAQIEREERSKKHYGNKQRFSY